jgi:hypothetical protein
MGSSSKKKMEEHERKSKEFEVQIAKSMDKGYADIIG